MTAIKTPLQRAWYGFRHDVAARHGVVWAIAAVAAVGLLALNWIGGSR